MIIINRERACALTVRMLKRRKRGSERESERERDGAPPITDNLIKSDDALQLGELFTLHWVVPFEGGTATASLSLSYVPLHFTECFVEHVLRATRRFHRFAFPNRK